ncbi:MAG: two-component system, OmpR family, response regulator ResD [Clostridia bacterium]|nr:two-component system, OmpR family, response regulator ResD [Clostridia bacterium]
MQKTISILVIDDEERIRSLVKMYLEKEGYKIDEAVDGDEALEKVRNKSYNLLILDLMLPGTDGLAVCGFNH